MSVSMTDVAKRIGVESNYKFDCEKRNACDSEPYRRSRSASVRPSIGLCYAITTVQIQSEHLTERYDAYFCAIQ